ncbi:hypothetical protein ATANTOWER_026274 [Ataeniobius toweri]|uniref:Uncharacterized protein n=1 Tax=Ataeniobius toweri TaxID=208326 RepID=A0ABU7BVS2_9TELE|nr:hypothetical protein [Ataeniobius toweri]
MEMSRRTKTSRNDRLLAAKALGEGERRETIPKHTASPRIPRITESRHNQSESEVWLKLHQSADRDSGAAWLLPAEPYPGFTFEVLPHSLLAASKPLSWITCCGSVSYQTDAEEAKKPIKAAKVAFSWQDPLDLEGQLTEEEVMIRVPEGEVPALTCSGENRRLLCLDGTKPQQRPE